MAAASTTDPLVSQLVELGFDATAATAAIVRLTQSGKLVSVDTVINNIIEVDEPPSQASRSHPSAMDLYVLL
jgi:hypothetical protein